MPEDDSATSKPPAPMGTRNVGDAPENLAGALPENAGRDPSDTVPRRSPAGTATPDRPLTASEQRNRDVAAFLNRLIMLEQHALHIVQDVRDAESDPAARARLTDIVNEDRRATEVLERAVRDLNGRVNPVRKTGGFLIAKARVFVEDLPNRARRAMEQRDVNAIREEPPFRRMSDYMDAHAAEWSTAAHWDALHEMASVLDERGLTDAVNECRDSAHAHADYLKSKIPQAVRDAVGRANVAQSR